MLLLFFFSSSSIKHIWLRAWWVWIFDSFKFFGGGCGCVEGCWWWRWWLLLWISRFAVGGGGAWLMVVDKGFAVGGGGAGFQCCLVSRRG